MKKLPINPLFIFAGVIVVVAGAGYFIFSKSSSSNPISGIINKVTNNNKNSSVKKLIEASLVNIKDPLLRKHYSAQYSVQKMRQKFPVADKPGVIYGLESEVSADQLVGTTQGSSRMWLEQNGKKLFEYMVIGETTYVKDNTDNKWWKQTKKQEATVTGTPETNAFSPEDLKAKPEPTPAGGEDEAKKVGEEACPNVPNLTCYKYQETLKAMEGFSETKTTFWFDKQKFLKRKEIQETDGNTTWYEYEYENINLTPPSPTKDVPAGKDIGEYIGQMYLNSLPAGEEFTAPPSQDSYQEPSRENNQEESNPEDYSE